MENWVIRLNKHAQVISINVWQIPFFSPKRIANTRSTPIIQTLITLETACCSFLCLLNFISRMPPSWKSHGPKLLATNLWPLFQQHLVPCGKSLLSPLHVQLPNVLPLPMSLQLPMMTFSCIGQPSPGSQLTLPWESCISYLAFYDSCCELQSAAVLFIYFIFLFLPSNWWNPAGFAYTGLSLAHCRFPFISGQKRCPRKSCSRFLGGGPTATIVFYLWCR